MNKQNILKVSLIALVVVASVLYFNINNSSINPEDNTAAAVESKSTVKSFFNKIFGTKTTAPVNTSTTGTINTNTSSAKTLNVCVMNPTSKVSSCSSYNPQPQEVTRPDCKRRSDGSCIGIPTPGCICDVNQDKTTKLPQ